MEGRQAALGGLALVAAVGIGILVGRGTGDAGPVGTDLPAIEATTPQADTAGDPAGGLPDLTPLEDASAVAEATAVVDAFLAAEAADDFDASYALLSADDAEQYIRAAGWRQAHADFPGVESHSVIEVGVLSSADGQVVARVSLDLDSILNEFVGLVPARAVGSYVVVEEAGEWRVVFTESTILPQYPDDGGVVAAATEWVTAGQDCGEPDGPYDGRIYGPQDIQAAFCDAEGPVAMSQAATLEEGGDTTALVSAFGPEVFRWARQVTVTSPTQARLVLAPVADTWAVIGVFPGT